MHWISKQKLIQRKPERGIEFNNIWNTVWSAHVQPKVRILLWKACKNMYCLPKQICLIQVFLKHIHVGCVDQVVWQCEFAQCVWHDEDLSV